VSNEARGPKDKRISVILNANWNYDKTPAIAVDGAPGACVQGWDAVAERLRRAIAERDRKKITLVVECYPGVRESEVLGELRARLSPELALEAREALLSPERIDALAGPFLGGDDPVFGFLCGLRLPQFFDPAKVERLREKIRCLGEGRGRYSCLCRSGALGGAKTVSEERDGQPRRGQLRAGGGVEIQARILRRLAGL
jgi:hypothetical protein